MTKLSDTAKQLLILAMEGEQGVLGNQRIERTNHHPTWWYEQFTVTAGGDLFYEESPNTEHLAAQASAAVNELRNDGLVEVESESEDKKQQRFRITAKGAAHYDKLERPAKWISRGETL